MGPHVHDNFIISVPSLLPSRLKLQLMKNKYYKKLDLTSRLIFYLYLISLYLDIVSSSGGLKSTSQQGFVFWLESIRFPVCRVGRPRVGLCDAWMGGDETIIESSSRICSPLHWK